MDNDAKTEMLISNVDKDDVKKLDALEEQPQKCDPESEHKEFSIYTHFMMRMCLLSAGQLIFIIAFLEAMKITGFDATKLILLEICLLVLLVFIVGVSVALTRMRHEGRAKDAISVLLYFAALIVMVSFLLVWAFFKATPV
ncbi:hypothetical protein B0O40_0358 [Ruminococcaceae bacterium R-25]|nr:hypothetical protein B0O40_0358 [Ruminococcaceae bacterium R-25]SUQ10995.1 hypothetical protein SAMN06297423_0358 [Oscillospiraceae bacterium]